MNEIAVAPLEYFKGSPLFKPEPPPPVGPWNPVGPAAPPTMMFPVEDVAKVTWKSLTLLCVISDGMRTLPRLSSTCTIGYCPVLWIIHWLSVFENGTTNWPVTLPGGPWGPV